MTDTKAQVRAIRSAIGALEKEDRMVRNKPAQEPRDEALRAEVLQDIKNEIAALSDAIEALRAADAFRVALRTFTT